MKNIFKERKIYRDFFLVFLIQIAILIAALVLYSSILKSSFSSIILQETRIAGGEETSPHLARLVYMLFAFGLGTASIFAVNILDKKQNSKASFWTGITGGILLWQSIGECSWHFAIPCFDEGKIIFNYLPRIEGSSSTMLLIPFVICIALLIKNNAFSFGMLSLVLSFTGNWVGHFISVGTYPVVSRFFEEASWYKISGIIYGLALAVTGFLNGIKENKNCQQRMIRSVVFYFGIAAIPLAFMEG